MTHPRPSGQDPFVDLTDDAAHQAAVRARSDRRMARTRAGESATWVGTLHDLAERRAPVVLTVGAVRLAGTLTAVGADHVVLRTSVGEQVWLRIAAVRSLAPDPATGAGPVAGHRDTAPSAELADLLDHAAEQRCTVRVFVRDVAEPIRAHVEAVGEDLLTLRLDAAGRPRLYVPLAAVDAVALS
jgi:hypothetical protein